MKKILYLILSIAFFVLSIPPLNWSFLIFVAFVPLFLFARESGNAANFFAGLLTGLCYYGVLFYWIGVYSFWGAVAIIGGLGLTFAVYLAITGYFLARSRDSWFDWLFPGSAWIVLKWLISFWKPGFLALHITDNLGLDLRQTLYITGENGLVFFIFLVNAWIFNFVRVKKPLREHMIQLLIVAVLLLGMNSFARMRLGEEIPAEKTVAVIQPNLPYDVDWRKTHYNEMKALFEKQTREAAKSNPALIVWPQYAFPEDLRKTPNPASDLAAELKIPILLGTYVKSEDGSPINIALYFSAEGKLAGEYEAAFLPPLRNIGQKKGDSLGLIETSLGKAGVMLCFDDTHPYLMRQLVRGGAQILFVLANDQVFDRTSEPRLHAGRDVLRAIEADRFLIRSAPTGPSEIIDPRGRVVAATKQVTEAVLSGNVSSRQGSGPFVLIGNLISYLAFAILGAILARWRKQQWLNSEPV